MKFTFQAEDEDETIVTIITKQVVLGEVIDEFKNFLLGCGYSLHSINDYLGHENER